MDSALKHKKHVWFVCCNIGLFSVSLHQKKVFFQYAASQPDFHLILLKQRFCFLLAELRCLRIVFLRTALFSVSLTKLHFGRSILPRDVLACWQLNQVTLSLKSVSVFLCLKYAVFSFIAGKTCFGLFAVKLGCFRRYCTEKMFSPSLQRVTLIFTRFYSKQRFCLFSGKLRSLQYCV